MLSSTFVYEKATATARVCTRPAGGATGGPPLDAADEVESVVDTAAGSDADASLADLDGPGVDDGSRFMDCWRDACRPISPCRTLASSSGKNRECLRMRLHQPEACRIDAKPFALACAAPPQPDLLSNHGTSIGPRASPTPSHAWACGQCKKPQASLPTWTYTPSSGRGSRPEQLPVEGTRTATSGPVAVAPLATALCLPPSEPPY